MFEDLLHLDVKWFIHFVLIICVLCVVSDRLHALQHYYSKSLCQQEDIYAMKWHTPQKTSGFYSW